MKHIYTLSFVLLCTLANAQTINDVLRFSIEDVQGTARYQALSGAFGALGGELSALGINPAGSAVFNNGQFSITGSVHQKKNNSLFNGSATSTSGSRFKLNQVGGVWVFKNYGGGDWKKLALAVNYDLVQNFDNEIFIRGNTPVGIDQYFLNYAQGVPLGPLRVQEGEFIEDAYLDIGGSLGFGAQQAFLGFQSGFIDPVDFEDNNNTEYFSNADYDRVDQSYLQSSYGYNSKFTMNFAGQYKDFLSIGTSLNFHSVFYESVTTINESSYSPDSEIQLGSFDNFLRTQGSGFSIGLGAIARLGDIFRVGASYQSPTWYQLVDDLSQRVNSDFPDKNPDITFIDFSIVNFFPRYTIKSPARYTGSLAMVFGNKGLLSFDYGFQDMSRAELRPTSDPDFNSENIFISQQLGGVSTLRAGGEYRIGRVSFRGGYRSEQSPYRNNSEWGNLQGYSGGLGFGFGPSRLDFTFSQTRQNIPQSIFELDISSASVERVNSFYTFTYTLNF
ncbi:aromatic hydrocarbon degradation protein [Robiginitalea aurantiaca]|uniref:Aromatic hydrocarbon degradation protein n=1 Tax=Robiginitalea aurantiaca TaxID=3056915 RepID=A0ABT7WDH4_9FLAO|nr:aromatic hydrocarbon degradation protein [Robiginitalea aurantiaca]MDM9630956.1 aromatic hydrocarbon degradation protein [Robiginitalea aurantiaca]